MKIYNFLIKIKMWINGFFAASKRAAVYQRRVLSLGTNLKYRLNDTVHNINSIVGVRCASSTSGLWLPNSNQVKIQFDL